MKISSALSLLAAILTTLGACAALTSRAVRAEINGKATRVVLKGLVCAYCAQGFERTLHRHPEVESVRVRLGTHDAVIAFREGASMTEAQLREAAREAGLGVARVERVERIEEPRREARE